jgi:hypothetical protein
MLTTALTGPNAGVEQTIRLRPGDLPVRALPTTTVHDESKTTKLPALPLKPLPKAVSAIDSNSVRLRAIEIAKTVRMRYADLNTPPPPGYRPSEWLIARVVLVLVLASMPILSISVDVFGLVSQSATSVAVIVVSAILGAVVTFSPHRMDMIVGRGLIAGMVACVVYDGARLFAVHVLGLMGDFIPVMGSWVTGEPDTNGSAAVGYVWRYIGDGGGLGVAFFVVAFALGIDRWSNVHAVLAAVGFAVFPTWTGLIATVALAPRGEEMMFPLNVATVTITLVGHLIFGLVLGLAFLKAPRGPQRSEWPWPPILESAPVKRAIAKARKIAGLPEAG